VFAKQMASRHAGPKLEKRVNTKANAVLARLRR